MLHLSLFSKDLTMQGQVRLTKSSFLLWSSTYLHILKGACGKVEGWVSEAQGFLGSKAILDDILMVNTG